MKTTVWALAGIALFSGFFTRAASANLLQNGSLEIPSAAPLGTDPFLMVHASTADTSTLPNWTINGSIDVVPSSYWQATNGDYSVDLIGSPGVGAISQSVTGLSVGAVYVLSFDLAFNPSNYQGESITTKQLQVSVTNPSSSVIASQLFQGTGAGASYTTMNYTSQSIQFTADAASETISLAALVPLNLPGDETAADVACGPVVDNLDLEYISGGSPNTPNAPEPASLGLLGFGGLMLLRRKAARTH